MGLSQREVAAVSGVSTSHLGRIERGERFPSAYILQRIAKPLGFEENELFTFAGFLSPISTKEAREKPMNTVLGLDQYVAQVLTEETPEVQRCVIGILTILKSIAKNMERENLQQ